MDQHVLKYRYLDEGRSHLHQIWSVTPEGEEVWQPLIGTSTVAKESVNKGDGLMQWYADLAALDALGKPMPEGLVADYEAVQAIQDKWAKAKASKELDKKYPVYAEARKAAIRKRDGSAKSGTDRHGELELYVKKCLEINFGMPIEWKTNMHPDTKVFVEWSSEHVDRFVFSEAHCFSAKLWLGGISDIGMILKDGRRVLGDHKSSKSAFFDAVVQAVLYDIELEENGILDRNGNKLGDWLPADGVVIFPFRSNPFKPEFFWDMKKLRSVAENIVETYRCRIFLGL